MTLAATAALSDSTSRDSGMEMRFVASCSASLLAPLGFTADDQRGGLCPIDSGVTQFTVGGGEIDVHPFHPIGDRGPLGFEDRQTKMRAHRAAHHLGIVRIDGFRREQHGITSAAAADRSSVPRLPGSRSESAIKIILGVGGHANRGKGRTAIKPCGVSVSLHAFSTASDTVLISTPRFCNRPSVSCERDGNRSAQKIQSGVKLAASASSIRRAPSIAKRCSLTRCFRSASDRTNLTLSLVRLVIMFVVGATLVVAR